MSTLGQVTVMSTLTGASRPPASLTVPWMLEKTCHLFNKGPESRLYEEFLKINDKKTNNTT